LTKKQLPRSQVKVFEVALFASSLESLAENSRGLHFASLRLGAFALIFLSEAAFHLRRRERKGARAPRRKEEKTRPSLLRPESGWKREKPPLSECFAPTGKERNFKKPGWSATSGLKNRC